MGGGVERRLLLSVQRGASTTSPAVDATPRAQTRPYGAVRFRYRFDPEHLRRDRGDYFQFDGRLALPGGAGRDGAAYLRARFQHVRVIGWDEFWIQGFGNLLAGDVFFTEEESLGADALRGAFSGSDYTRRLVGAGFEYRYSLWRDVFKLGVFTNLAVSAPDVNRIRDRLAALAPRASHLVHMPSHTYYWVGRYEDAAKANMRAVELGIDNAKRLNMPPPEGVWGLPYHSHNVTFGLGGAIEAGDADIALRLGRPLVSMAQAKAEGSPFMQMIAANGYYAMARFADPAEVLSLPKPKLPYLQAARHYARGEAFARRNNVEGVRAEAAAIHGLPGELGKDDGSAQAQTMTFIARNVLIGRAAMMDRRPREAALAFTQAAELQESDDFTSVSDPPAWGYPVRRDLAAALLAQGDQAGARRELDAALKYRPKDPGALAMRRKLEARTAAR